ncbi:MAG: hypothetical protein ABIV48_05985, partial [Pyrinomonadaceae bacterium]
AFIPWIVAVWTASGASTGLSQNIGWMQRPGISAIAHFKFNLIEPFYYVASNVDPLSIYRVTVPLMILMTVAAVLYVINWKRSGADEKGAVYFLAIFSFFPAFLAFASSWLLPHSIWGTRHLIIVFAPVSILLAIVVTNIFNTRLKTAFLTLIVLFAGYGFALQASRESPQYIWCAWEKLADDFSLAPHYAAEKKRVYVFEDLVAYHFWYRLRHLENYDVRVVNGIDGINDDSAYFLPRGFDGVQRVGIDEISEQRIWIAFRGPKTVESPGIAFIGAGLGPPASGLSRLGFEVENVQKIDMGDQTAYLVLMSKGPPPDHPQ